jgi:hypothetical protein
MIPEVSVQSQFEESSNDLHSILSYAEHLFGKLFRFNQSTGQLVHKRGVIRWLTLIS